MKSITLLLTILFLSSCANQPEGFKTMPINDDGFVGEYLYNDDNVVNPIVLVIPGSGSGQIPSKVLKGLVKSGYDVLSIAYFGKKNLPKRISRIPIEYLSKTITWIKGRSDTKNRKLVLLSISKGTELGLLYASKNNDIDGIICYAPSSFVFPDHVGIDADQPLVSSWTYEGKDLDYASIKRFDAEAGQIIYKDYTESALIDSLENKKAWIGVEQIECPILLLSGKSDLVWPSFQMSEMILRMVKNKNPDANIRSIGYEDAGHQFLWLNEGQPTKVTTNQSIRLTGIKKHRFMYGGSKEGTKKAMVESRKEVLKFLEKLK